ncbi:MAG: GlcG/HbpS family heme-binding protein [Caldisphaera sp.]|jgi:uncharacterized protein GlcG (DUF336 family)|nr:heme-binding protein [Caldisphaera sp.]PMP89541.1 MAG: cobalamin adenosyltransferase [Caldisphaera sp.]
MKKTFVKESITDELSLKMIDTAKQKALEIGKPSVIAIVDESGILKAFLRMDGAPLLSVQVAIDKAYTAAGYNLPTHTWYDFIKNDPPLAAGATTGIDRLVIFGGGFPIKINGKTIGGIGVSGGHYTEDMEVAEAALKVIEGE